MPKKYQKYPFVLSSLTKFGIKKEQIIFLRRKSNIKVKELALVSAPPQNQQYFEQIRKALRNDFEASEKIYVSREEQVLRFVENEREVSELLAKYGFKKIIAEKLSYQEQIDIFSKTKYLVSPHGAGLANIFFMPEDSSILELATELPTADYYKLSALLRIKYFYQKCDFGSRQPVCRFRKTGKEPKINARMIHLKDRAIIEISGADRKKFLQGLITNDVEKTSATNLIYAVMLNAPGRFLYDFFIFDDGEKLVLDCLAARRDEIFQKLNFYKLRSQVVIKKNDELKVISNENGQGFLDPRNPKLGHRLYGNATCDSLTNYELLRISLKVPESESDLTYEKSLILEFGFDDLNAIDYNKGCYVGQELTARTHYRGEIRKKIFHVVIPAQAGIQNNALGASNKTSWIPAYAGMTRNAIEKNSEIYCEGKSVGIILSSIFHKNELHALALVKDSQDIDLQKLDLSGHKISVIS